jgi:hypothetical protein
MAPLGEAMASMTPSLVGDVGGRRPEHDALVRQEREHPRHDRVRRLEAGVRRGTGGYPVIGVVREADLPIAAQLRPGDQVWFTARPAR